MATLTIAEYTNVGPEGLIIEPPAVVQTAVTTTTSAQSAAFGANTRAVVLSAVGGNIHYLFGANPTATANCPILQSGTSRLHVIAPGSGLKVAGLTGV